MFDFLVDLPPLQDQAYLIQFTNKKNHNVLAVGRQLSYCELSSFVVEARKACSIFFVISVQVGCRLANTPSRKPACCIAGKVPVLILLIITNPPFVVL